MTLLAEMAALALRHAPECGRTSPAPGLLLMRADGTTGPVGGLYGPSLCVVLQGAKRTSLGSRSFRYDAGKYLVASVDLPVTGRIIEASPRQPYLAMALSIDAASLSALLLENEADTAAPPAPGLAICTLEAELAEPLLRLLRLLDRPRDIPALLPLLSREILYRLLQGPQRGMLRQLALAGSPTARIARAIGWIREHYDAPLRIEALARLAHMSPSTFHRHFRAVTALTPLQFQKQLRLQEARRRLLAGEAEIASVGFALGYESPSQFSREYRRLFGEPPGRDGAALRAALGPAGTTADPAALAAVQQG
ncbi:AraC family transcriptional regulator [Teichococcus vastitatis]|uniref:AraC family transcriptional regulator n=1 Tax=Teichococcus vastitatis TaxID=2307076 RepID=A0ABS9W1D2_9PROT|nr:AraC family transcriptional regulator [Pseudoroseomonas vastitatis]MCI0752655.1 AraC family transcriptional regulator [Pseudoroseomonas vastitatis]